MRGKHWIKHGAHARPIRAKYEDRRTTEGRTLAEAINGLVEHFGGAAAISAPMQLLIDANIRPKLITLLSINSYINKQKQLINNEGELLPCLSKSYIAFSNALRHDLTALLDMAKNNGVKPKIPRIEDLINGQPDNKR